MIPSSLMENRETDPEGPFHHFFIFLFPSQCESSSITSANCWQFHGVRFKRTHWSRWMSSTSSPSLCSPGPRCSLH